MVFPDIGRHSSEFVVATFNPRVPGSIPGRPTLGALVDTAVDLAFCRPGRSSPETMTVHSGLVCARGWPERTGSCPGDEGGGLLGGVAGDLGEDRGVGVGGDGDGGVPQQLGDDLQVGAGGEGEGGGAVPEVVQPDRGEVGGGGQPGELPAYTRDSEDRRYPR